MAELTQEGTTKVKKSQYDLVKGEFTAEQASEILHDLFTRKISFNKQKRLSQQVRFGIHDSKIDVRISELQDAHNRVRSLLETAKSTGKNLRIDSSIFIELIED